MKPRYTHFVGLPITNSQTRDRLHFLREYPLFFQFTFIFFHLILFCYLFFLFACSPFNLVQICFVFTLKNYSIFVTCYFSSFLFSPFLFLSFLFFFFFFARVWNYSELEKSQQHPQWIIFETEPHFTLLLITASRDEIARMKDAFQKAVARIKQLDNVHSELELDHLETFKRQKTTNVVFAATSDSLSLLPKMHGRFLPFHSYIFTNGYVHTLFSFLFFLSFFLSVCLSVCLSLSLSLSLSHCACLFWQCTEILFQEFSRVNLKISTSMDVCWCFLLILFHPTCAHSRMLRWLRQSTCSTLRLRLTPDVFSRGSKRSLWANSSPRG